MLKMMPIDIVKMVYHEVYKDALSECMNEYHKTYYSDRNGTLFLKSGRASLLGDLNWRELSRWIYGGIYQYRKAEQAYMFCYSLPITYNYSSGKSAHNGYKSL